MIFCGQIRMRMKKEWQTRKKHKGMRVFTDGACSSNGRKDAKAGFAAWFPEHPEWSDSKRLPIDEPQTNQRAELAAIHLAVSILSLKGAFNEDLVIYTDSDYSIKCFTEWMPGWVARGWKTSLGKPVLHRDLIEAVAEHLSKFKHRFHHVRAHTGGVDDLSKQNDVVDRMAREAVDGRKIEMPDPKPSDELFPGCPLAIMGAPVSSTVLTDWIRENLHVLEPDVVDKYLMKAFAEMCKTRNVTLSKNTVAKQAVYRAELTVVHVEKTGV
jgi:ribonuclease HI